MGYTDILLTVKAAILFEDRQWEERVFPNITISYNPLDEDPTTDDLIEAVNRELGREEGDAIVGVCILESFPTAPKVITCNVLVAVCQAGGTWTPRTFENLAIETQSDSSLPSNQEVLDTVSPKVFAEGGKMPIGLAMLAFTRSDTPAGAAFQSIADTVLNKNSDLYRRLTRL